MIGKVHVKQIYEIALAKRKDVLLQRTNIEEICKSIAGSCASIGLEVVSD